MFSRPPKSRSLTRELTAGLALVTIVAVAVTWVSHGILLERTARTFMYNRLTEEIAFIKSRLRTEGISVASQLEGTSYFNTVFHHIFLIELSDGRLFASHSEHIDEFRSSVSGADSGLSVLDVAGETFIALRSPFNDPEGTDGIITVAERYSVVAQGLVRLHWWAAGTALMLLLMLGAINIAVLRRFLRPLKEIQEGILALERGDRSRLEIEPPDELRGLVQQLNELISVQERRLVRYRESLSNLSHALKTPLAAVYQTLITRKQVSASLQSRLAEEITQALGRVDAELHRARFSGVAAPGTVCSPERQIRHIIDTLAAVYSRATISLDSSDSNREHCPLDRYDFDELVGNLVDNALKWCHGQVRVKLRSNARSLDLAVDDDGPGVDPESCAELGRKGRRLDENTPGTGHGLYIVRQLIEDYGGEVTFGRSVLGGFSVNLSIPLR